MIRVRQESISGRNLKDRHGGNHTGNAKNARDWDQS